MTSDQLDLGLGYAGRAYIEPWGGVSARGLTKIAIVLSLQALPPGGLPAGLTSGCIDRQQEELGQLLLPFAREVYYG